MHTAPMTPTLSLSTILTCGACIVALACGHEAPAPAAPLAPVAAPSPAPAPAVTSAVTLTAAELPADARCIEVDAELGGKHTALEGRIFVDTTHEHPSRGKTRPFILRLDTPRCAIGTSEPRVAEVHLASSEGVVLKPLVGKHVRVAGEPFLAHTAWHARPIVLMTTTATPL